jgi:L-threonine-O-3-phosphate decarboxylase/precorrin-6x reductase
MKSKSLSPAKILLVCGTIETNIFAETIVNAGYNLIITTATDSFLQINNNPSIDRRTGRLDLNGFIELIKNEAIEAIVNAPHPYAKEVRQIVQQAAEQTGIPCLSYVRNESVFNNKQNFFFVDSHSDAAALACSLKKPTLLTIGSNNIKEYVHHIRQKSIPLIARVLPRIDSLQLCFDAGLTDKELIAARGPFSTDENVALIKRYAIGTIVTKNSGKEGGFDEKIEAAEICGCQIIVVNRPAYQVNRFTFEDTDSLQSSLETLLTRPQSEYPKIHYELLTGYNKHGGNLREISEIYSIARENLVDFSANINPFGPVSNLKEIIIDSIESIYHYPDTEYKSLINAISAFGNWPESNIIPANGASELIYAVASGLQCRRAVIPVPSYTDYTTAAEQANVPVKHFFLSESDNFSLTINNLSEQLNENDLVILGRPNNPTGTCLSFDKLEKLITDNPRVLFVIDESFIEFSDNEISIACALHENAVMIRSMTKFYCIPGLRLGYAIAPANLISKIKKRIIPWSINCIAERITQSLLANLSYQQQSREYVRKMRDELILHLKRLTGVTIFPSNTNFILIKLPDTITGLQIFDKLVKNGIVIRQCSNFTGLSDQFIRIAVRTTLENQLLIDNLQAVWKECI